MNGSVRERWLARLRSGQDGQCRRFLHPRPGVFDVLGVLVDIYIQEQGLAWSQGRRRLFTFGRIESVLPPEVRRWAGLTGPESQRLVDLNDQKGYSFLQLADYIETHIKGENSDEQSIVTTGTGSAVGRAATPGPARRKSVE